MTLQQLKYIIAIADNNSFNKAAAKLYVSQPNLSLAVKDLEEEIGVTIFHRTSKGITVTPEGNEFIEGARQLIDQFQTLQDRNRKKKYKPRFSVSSQHYGFAVKAFAEIIKCIGTAEYDFFFHEERTMDIIENVYYSHSELGLISMSDFNRRVIQNSLSKNELEFHKLIDCNICVYVNKTHPLADRERISLKDLEQYPFITFERGKSNSFYFAEEFFEQNACSRNIEVSDRACMLTLMQELDGYTFITDIVSENVVNMQFTAIPIEDEKKAEVGYIKRSNAGLSSIGQMYIEMLRTVILKNQ